MVTRWDDIYMIVATAVAKRSKDESTKVGAVIVSADQVLVSVGFNGPPRCIDDSIVPWDRRPDKYAWIIHAEVNAILFGLQRQKLDACTLYCTSLPCCKFGCMALITQVGIKRVVYGRNTTHSCDDFVTAHQIASAAGITLEIYNG